MIKLFLDDEREPAQGYEFLLSQNNPIYLTDGWIIVRNYEDFVHYIKSNPMPDLISFDHDLGKTPCTGHTCARFLIDWCNDHNLVLPQYLVHSANIIGRRNILSSLDAYLKFKSKHATPEI